MRGGKKKILLHPSLPLALVYLGHIMFGLTAVPVTGCMLPACRATEEEQQEKDLSALERLVFLRCHKLKHLSRIYGASTLRESLHFKFTRHIVTERNQTPLSASVFILYTSSKYVNTGSVFFNTSLRTQVCL